MALRKLSDLTELTVAGPSDEMYIVTEVSNVPAARRINVHNLAGSAFSGYSGYSGKSGYSGANPGASGYSGYSGSGLSGYSGYSGKSGYSGYSGSGLSGYSGYSGYSGLSGYSGYSGKSGYSGYSGATPSLPMSVANGGTGQTTASTAINALLPAQGSATGQFLTTNGSAASWGAVAAQVGFGSWSARTLGTVYQAATDGIAIAFCTSGNGEEVNGYTDGNNPPTTMRWKSTQSSSGHTSAIMPVRKGDYYKFTGGTSTMFFLPLGS